MNNWYQIGLILLFGSFMYAMLSGPEDCLYYDFYDEDYGMNPQCYLHQIYTEIFIFGFAFLFLIIGFISNIVKEAKGGNNKDFD